MGPEGFDANPKKESDSLNKHLPPELAKTTWSEVSGNLSGFLGGGTRESKLFVAGPLAIGVQSK